MSATNPAKLKSNVQLDQLAERDWTTIAKALGLAPAAPQTAGNDAPDGSVMIGGDLIGPAMEKTRAGDAGALFEPPVLALLKSIRQKTPAKWARIRQEAKETHKVSLADLDKLTAGKGESGGGMFEDVEPWPEPVDGARLLDAIFTLAGKHVIADPATLHVAALWIVMTWLMDVVGVAPIANITAPEKGCGKTALLSFIGKLAYRPLQVSNIAPAALFRSIEAWSPTLLIDEVDSFLRDNEEARGILDAGFTQDSAFVVRCVGDDHTPTKFSVWGAKALCGIGKLADTLADRSIPLRMRRKLPGGDLEGDASAAWVMCHS
jgi:hypothetical protein